MSILRNLLKSDRKCLSKFIFNLGWKGITGFQKYQRRKKNGELFPAYQFISITNDCNLTCQGCWVSKGAKAENLDKARINKIIKDSKKHGSFFFGILGGEPLLYKELTGIFRSHPDCYFMLFTNGTLLNDSIAEDIRKCANVTPLISFEGDEQIADIRRGGRHIFRRTIGAVETSVRHKLITGVAMSVCKSNIELALSEEFIRMLHDKGVVYLWYYIYRPTGENPHYELALSADEILSLRRFMVNGRLKYPIILIDSYWDAEGKPFCPAAEGLSHHINPSGNIEPCPVVQFSGDHINGSDLREVYENSLFLRDFRSEVLKKTKGCILMEDPDWLQKFAADHKAVNTSNRANLEHQLAGAPFLASHGSCPKIREKSWVYRMAKKRAFFGLGAYG